jgi:hypothetical protein
MDDVVATVAMPRRLLTNSPGGPVPTPAAISHALASTTPMAMPSPLHQAGGYANATGSGADAIAQAQTNSAGGYAHQPAAQQPGYPNVQPTQAMPAYPGWQGGNAPTNQGPNQGQWRQQTGPTLLVVEPSVGETITPQKRSIPFLFWGVLAAVLGFAIVGVVLFLTR